MEVHIEHVQLGFIGINDGELCSVAVQNNKLVLALSSGQLLWIDLDAPAEVLRGQIPALDIDGAVRERITKLWLSPGCSCTLLKTSLDHYFLCKIPEALCDRISTNRKQSVTAKHTYSIKKLTNSGVRCVDWIGEKELLLGARDRSVWHVNFSKSYGSPTVERIYHSKNSPAVEGVKWHYVKTHKSSSILLAHGNEMRLWRLQEGETPTQVLQKASKTPQEEEQFHNSGLTHANATFASMDDKFAWHVLNGIVYGKMNPNEHGSVLSSAKLLLKSELTESKHHIRDLVLTPYHIILLRGASVIIFSQLNNTIVLERSIALQENEKMIGLSVDYSQSPPTYWCYSNRSIFEIIVEKESNAVWQLLCDASRFSDALKLQGLSKREVDAIYYKQGKYLLRKGDYKSAANSLAQANYRSLSSIACELWEEVTHDESLTDVILKDILIERLKDISQDSSKKMQQVIISSWITWLFMKLMSSYDELMSAELNADLQESRLNTQRECKLEFRSFLKQFKGIMHSPTIYDIILKQNRKEELLYLANLMNDHKKVLDYWVTEENWYESLKLLVRLQDLQAVYDLALILLINAPEQTIKSWMQIRSINPKNMIAPILSYFSSYLKQSDHHPNKTNWGLKYLTWGIEKNEFRDPIIYNTVLYMLIVGNSNNSLHKEAQMRDESQIIKFLDDNRGFYDDDFILRLSKRFQRTRTLIYLYTQLKMFKEAVELALQHDMIDDAKEAARNTELNDLYPLRKRLWLSIARYMLSRESFDNDTKHLVSCIIQDSNGTLTIKDILPLLDSITTVANIKDELIKNLEDHRNTMTRISKDIELALDIKKNLLNEFEHAKNRYALLAPGASCDSCHRMLQLRKFLVFPCGHCFHTDCLVKAVLKSQDYNMKSKLEVFQKRLSQDRKTVVKRELDDLLTTKCCLCSDINITSINNTALLNDRDRSKWDL